MSTIHGVAHAQKITSYGVGAAGAASTDPGAPSLLPEPADPGPLGGDVFTELAALLEKAGQDDRCTARREEAQAEITQASEDAAKVAAMHAKADAEGAQGFAEGMSQIGDGLLEMGAGACEIREGGCVSAGKGGLAEQWKGGSQVLMGASKGAQAYGSFAGKADKMDADHRDADAAAHGANASTAERASKRAHEAMQAANDSLQKIAKFLEEVESGTNSARSAAVMRG